MSKDYLSIRDELRELERRVLSLHAKFEDNPEWYPLKAIATTIGSFAEMLPVYGSFVDLVEPIANDASNL